MGAALPRPQTPSLGRNKGKNFYQEAATKQNHLFGIIMTHK